MTKLPDTFPAPHPVPFGKYDLLGRVGRGGMADVYLGRPRGQKRLVAVKCMKEKLAARQQFVDMFIQEGKLAVQLNNESIVKTYEIGRIQGIYFICMEYISGVDLSLVLRACHASKSQRLPVPHALFIAVRILEGLDYAHRLTDNNGSSLNLVNRDVSPSNVRIAFDGEVKLLDFGIAKAASGLTSEIGVLKGKISHMSPEQVRGLPLDRRSDVFSASVVIHEMLTGEKLFRGDSDFRVMDLVRKAEVQPPSVTNQRVPKELDTIVARGLKKLPNERYQTAEDMAGDLRQLLARYKFNREELRDLLRDLCPDEWERERSIGKMVMEAPTPPEIVDSVPADANYGELYTDVGYQEVARPRSGGVAVRKKQPWWIWSLLGLAVGTFILAIVLAMVL